MTEVNSQLLSQVSVLENQLKKQTSGSYVDIQFEQNKHFNRNNNLDDDQLEDLFNEMKEEVMIKRKIKQEEMKERTLERMELDVGEGGLELEELGGLEDSDEELAPRKHYNDNFKTKLQNFRAQK